MAKSTNKKQKKTFKKQLRLKKKYAILGIILCSIIVFFLVLVGASYGFFSTQVTTREYVVYTGTLQVDFDNNGNGINLQGTKPMTNAEGLATTGYTFNVKNKGTINARYQVRLELASDNQIPIEYIKMAFSKTKDDGVTVASPTVSDPVLLSNLNSSFTFVSNEKVEPTKSDTMNLKIWLDFSAPNDMQGKTFKAKIVVDAIQDVDDAYAFNSIPVINMKEDASGNIHANLQVNDVYSDPGIESVSDDIDTLSVSNVTRTIEYFDGTNTTTVNSIDTSVTGVYFITYSIADSSNNVGNAVRVVTVNNTTAIPTITLNGSSPMRVIAGAYEDPGVTVASGNKVVTLGEVKATKPGTYTVKYIVIDPNGNMNSITRDFILSTPTTKFAYTGSVQEYEVPVTGDYLLEVWGAQGAGGSDTTGAPETGIGGKGGYSAGTVTLTAGTRLYVYVGGMGSPARPGIATGGFNGGGTAYGSSEVANGGGGATDIRIGQDSLYSRVIVAGGGGGAGEDGETGGYGGGVTAGVGGSSSITASNQTSAGTGGTFGNGANVEREGGAGGGGWYGGGTTGGISTYPAAASSSDAQGGNGGSGYVYTSSTAANYPSGCLLNSNYYLTNAETIAGNTSFTSPTGTSETGHSGNGYAKITYVIPISDFEYNGTTGTDGSVQTMTVSKTGRYKLEVWGAQGGYNLVEAAGGKGGYSVGTVSLTAGTNLYIYVGGHGIAATSNTSTALGGYNGGGAAKASNWGRASGGGASDIRIGQDSLYARVIVAGGGGGATGLTDGMASEYTLVDGASSGGGNSGFAGSKVTGTSQGYGSGGTQTSGGTNSDSKCEAGSFGLGGGYGSDTCAGGGAGWYGGAGGSGAGGGSGYVYTSSTAANCPSGCLLNSSYYLADAQTLTGNQSFTAPDGTTEIGHSGNGHVRITCLDN